MRPSQEDFLKSAAAWRGEHKGIHYKLSWHGLSEYNPEGTWCWYIYVNSELFYAEDWLKLRLKREDKQFSEGGSWHRHWDYDAFPDVDPHGGWTWGEMETYLGKDGVEYEQVEVGCDYAHHWDRESGYWQGREAVEIDCKRSIDLLTEMFPRQRERCDYSGKYDDSENFYTAKNGRRVHTTQRDKFDDGWDAWRPAAQAEQYRTNTLRGFKINVAVSGKRLPEISRQVQGAVRGADSVRPDADTRARPLLLPDMG